MVFILVGLAGTRDPVPFKLVSQEFIVPYNIRLRRFNAPTVTRRQCREHKYIILYSIPCSLNLLHPFVITGRAFAIVRPPREEN